MISAYLKLPPRLVRAHKDGRLVIFVGAGASKPSPSCLPLLGELVERVEKLLGVDHEPGALARWDSEPKKLPDEPVGGGPRPLERLEGLARRNLSVHVAVKDVISESVEPNGVHRAIVALAEAGGSARIVTTNYDRHLSELLFRTAHRVRGPGFPWRR